MRNTVGSQGHLNAEHEAGMHDIKRREACRSCQKEIEMAKQSTECDICGGKYDGTPSGLKKHVGTGKHIAALKQPEPTGEVAQAVAVAATVASAAPKSRLEITRDIAGQRLAENRAHLAWRQSKGPESMVPKYEALVGEWEMIVEALDAFGALLKSDATE